MTDLRLTLKKAVPFESTAFYFMYYSLSIAKSLNLLLITRLHLQPRYLIPVDEDDARHARLFHRA